MGINKGQSVCIFSAKGGVGKTITTINLAGIIEELDKRTLIIDLDLYSGTIASSLNIKPKNTIFEMVDDMANNRYESISNYVTKVRKYVDVLSAPTDPRNANKISSEMIERVINDAEFNYDVVLIDTNHLLNETNLVALSTVNTILFVTTNDPLDLHNLARLIPIFQKLDMTNYKILLNNSRDPFKDYYSMYDIKKILKTNVDYTISPQLFLKDIEKDNVSGNIPSTGFRFAKRYPEDYQTYLTIATDILEGDGNE